MVRKFLILLAALALAAFGLAACGGDDDDSGGEAATTTTEAPAEEPAGDGGDDDGAAGGAGGKVEFTADPDGGLFYEEKSAEASAGSVTLVLVNESPTPHDVRIEDADGNDLGGTEVISNDTAEATVELEPGEYTFYCSVPGHRQAGMEGTLTVN